MIPRVSRRFYASANSSALMRAQLDISGIIANKDMYRESIARRELPEETTKSLDFIVNFRKRQLELGDLVNSMRHERAQLGKIMKTPERSDSIKDKLLSLKNMLKPLEMELRELTERMYSHAESLPNLLDPTVPNGPEEIVNYINCSSVEDAENLLPASDAFDHKDIGVRLGILDFSVALRVLGHSWYYLIGDGALLEQALVQYALKKARQAGYKLVVPPSIVRSDVVHACGFKPKDQNGEKQVYTLEDENVSLTATAEIPLGALHSSSTIERPVKYVGVSRSYRAEAGARGKDTKGLYRVHEFTKVELFHFTSGDRSTAELEDLKNFQVDILNSLGIRAKMINMPTNDLGSPALKKYDLEAWMPGRAKWGELTSCSNCGDYQSRRLGVKLDGVHAHTLNGTAMAVPRVIVALIEQNYNPEKDAILIPNVLREYMDGKEWITKDE